VFGRCPLLALNGHSGHGQRCPQVSVGNQRAADLLAAHQRAVYFHKAEKLNALNRLINGE
jgi:hypothetical protein